MERVVSEKDINNLSLIRKNVDSFLSNAAKKLDSENVILLDIAPQVHSGAAGCFQKSTIFTLDINKESGANFICDITKNNSAIIANNFFDIVVCTEVLEHTYNPFDAINEISRILKREGGVLLLSTPFDFRIHGPLPDCWRFTEHALRYMLRNFADVSIYPLEQEDRFLMPIQYTIIAKK